MAGAGGGSRTLRATNKALKKDSNQKSSSTPSNSSQYRIPSLKFPFPWEVNKKQRIGRAAEQRAALISCYLWHRKPEKKLGVFLSEEAKSIDLLLPLAYEITRSFILRQCWSKIAETMIHRAIVSCQSFTLIGVAGSLLGSIPCFAKGCILVVQAFFMRFQAMPHTVHQGEIMKLLIHALDMFLIGTALLKFAMGLYTMFYGSKSIQKPEQHINSSHSGTFNLKKLKEGARLTSITQAKTRIGHAIVLLLQAGILEEFMSVPLASGLDMACFAGSVLASSAGVFLLSRLSG